jgi:outer membrane immunogenic protein
VVWRQQLGNLTGVYSTGPLRGTTRKPRLGLLRFRISPMSLKSAIRIVAIVALFATSVQAADLPEAPSSAPIPNFAEVPPAVSTSNWTGPYIGLGFGLRYDAVDANVTSATVGTPPAAIALPPAKTGSGNFLETAAPATMAYVDNIALRGGMYGGWNYQITPDYVIGAEVDFGWAHETAVLHGSAYPTNLLFGSPSLPFGATPQDSFRVTTDWDGSIALRVGRLLTPSTLLYVSGGLAWAHIQVTSTCSTTPTANVLNCAPGNYFSGTLGPAVIEQSATALGWTGAIGLETRLWSNWIARGQYRFSGFDYPSGSSAFTFATTRSCTGCPSAASSPLNVSFQLPVMQHSFEFGIAYLFGTSVQAADLPEAPSAAPIPNLAEVPPAVLIPSWTGPYIGLDFGFRYDAVEANVTSATVGTPPTAIALPPATTGSSGNYNIALRGGAYGGWNYQITPDYVIGAEVNFGWANETAVLQGSAYPGNLLFGSPSLPFGATPQDGFRVTTDWDGSIALRVGRLLTPSTLLYVSGGLAWAHIQVTSVCSHTPTANVSNCAPGNYFSGTLGPDVIEQSATALGWTGGIGLETRLWSNWIARGQYRFSEYPIGSSAFTFATTRSCTGCPSAASSPLNVSFQVPVMQHSFEFGIAYKFGS